MKIVKQEWDDGCGLACVAMICDKTFDEVANKITIERGKTGASTRIKDFEILLGQYGVVCKRERFETWEKLNGIYIVGVNERKDKNGKREGWHWVVVLKNKRKFLILDPDEDECINWGNAWIEEKDGYIARRNCDIIKCVNIKIPNSIKI